MASGEEGGGVSEGQVKAPRFPWPAAILCAASLGVAAWLWFAHSYCWDATDRFLFMDEPSLGLGTLVGRYVQVRGHPDSETAISPTYYGDAAPYGKHTLPRDVVFVEHDLRTFTVIVLAGEGPRASSRPDWRGRVVLLQRDQYAVDTTQDRFHGASISGLVVGAMGLAVFAVYLRSWVRERRAFPRA